MPVVVVEQRVALGGIPPAPKNKLEEHMFTMLSIAVGLLVLLVALGLYGLCHRRARADEPHDDLRRAGHHPAHAAYEPGAAYAKTAGTTGGGAL